MTTKADTEKIYGLIGYPLTHSFSQTFFNQKFESEKINARYINFELKEIGLIEEILIEYPNLRGFNVTIPYKEQIFNYLDAVDSEAQAIGAVNVVKIYRQPDGSVSLKGYNSDYTGFADSIRPLINPEIHKKALVLGSGGASKAVTHALRSMNIEPVIVSRTSRPGMLTYEELSHDVIDEHKVIVNTTPLGMYPHTDECPPIPYHYLTADHICYDLLYNPDVTLFMKRAAEQGASVKNGLEMLLLQAFISWNIWNK